MTEPIVITPEKLLTVAGHHEQIAGILDEARAQGEDIHAATQSLGPIMHQFKAAVSDVLAERDEAFTRHADRHRAASNELRVAAHTYTSVDEANAEAHRKLTDK